MKWAEDNLDGYLNFYSSTFYKQNNKYKHESINTIVERNMLSKHFSESLCQFQNKKVAYTPSIIRKWRNHIHYIQYILTDNYSFCFFFEFPEMVEWRTGQLSRRHCGTTTSLPSVSGTLVYLFCFITICSQKKKNVRKFLGRILVGSDAIAHFD